MRSSGSSKVVMAAGSQGLFLFVFCSFRPELCRNQCSLQSNRKNILCATELLLFYWISPRAKLTNLSSQHHPPNPFPPTKLTVPTPKYLYSYITSKHVLATLQTLVLRKHLVSYLEEKWECLVLHTAGEESPSQSVLSAVHQVTIQYNPLSKCTHST